MAAQQLFAAIGSEYSGAKAYTYVKDTTTDQAVYTDVALSVPATNPVVADSAGKFDWYFDNSKNYSVTIKTADDATTLFQFDYVAGAINIVWVADGTFASIAEASNVAGWDSDGLPVARSAAEMRALLDLEIGTDVQGYDADLAAIAALAKTDGNVIVGNGSTWVAESGATARASLGLVIGTDVQAYSANLAAINQSLSTSASPTFAGATIGGVEFPTSDGSANQVLATDGAGNLDFADPATVTRDFLNLGTSDSPQFAGLTFDEAFVLDIAPIGLASLNGADYSAGDVFEVLQNGATGQGRRGRFVLAKTGFTQATDYGTFVRAADYGATGSIFVRQAFYENREVYQRDYNGAENLTTNNRTIALAMKEANSDEVGATYYFSKMYVSGGDITWYVKSHLTSKMSVMPGVNEVIDADLDNLREIGMISTDTGDSWRINSSKVSNLIVLNQAEVGNTPYADETAAKAAVAAWGGVPFENVGNNSEFSDLLILAYEKPIDFVSGICKVKDLRGDCVNGLDTSSGGASIANIDRVSMEPWMTQGRGWSQEANFRPGYGILLNDNQDKNTINNYYTYGYFYGVVFDGDSSDVVNVPTLDQVRCDSGNIGPTLSVASITTSGSNIRFNFDPGEVCPGRVGGYIDFTGDTNTDHDDLQKIAAIAADGSWVEVVDTLSTNQTGTLTAVSVGLFAIGEVQLARVDLGNFQNYGINAMIDITGNGTADDVLHIDATMSNYDYAGAIVRQGFVDFGRSIFSNPNETDASAIIWENGTRGGRVGGCTFNRMASGSGDAAVMQFDSGDERDAVHRFGNNFDANVRDDKKFKDHNPNEVICRFSAALTSTQSNVTGDGTAYTIVFDTERYDSGGDYNAANGIFTAPVDGWYSFNAGAKLVQVDSDHRAQLKILTNNTNNEDFFHEINDPDDSEFTLDVSCDVYLEAGDTARVFASCSGGAAGKVVDVTGSSTDTFTYFQGHLFKEANT